MSVPRLTARVWLRSLLGVLLTASCSASFALETPSQAPESVPKEKVAPPAPAVARGQKLVLKDGTYQIIREYTRNGDRVRYYSVERGDWEELPASMVDWAATEKAAGDAAKASAAEVEKIHKQEEARRMDNTTDIDASLQVGTGVFLPDGDGMFVVEGKSIRIMDQVGSRLQADKMRTLAQILSPVPLVPGKQHLILAGARATLRLKTANPEFYLREPPPDPEKTSKIEMSSRPGDAGPDVELIQTKVTKSGRQLESISTLLGQQISKERNTISIQRWEVAPSVYRFTLSQALPPGEYVIAQIVPDGLNVFVWDFGLDGAAGK